MVATTSGASKGLPSLNLMPWRSLKVQTSPVSLGVQLSASRPSSDMSSLRLMRYSQNCEMRVMPPWS